MTAIVPWRYDCKRMPIIMLFAKSIIVLIFGWIKRLGFGVGKSPKGFSQEWMSISKQSRIVEKTGLLKKELSLLSSFFIL